MVSVHVDDTFPGDARRQRCYCCKDRGPWHLDDLSETLPCSVPMDAEGGKM
jgi:hypothetical protein